MSNYPISRKSTPMSNERVDNYLSEVYKDKRRRGLRRVKSIDRAIVSMFIKDDMNQTLESLCARMTVGLKYDFVELLEYFKKPDTLLYVTQIFEENKWCYIYDDWTPGSDNSYYLDKAHLLF